MRILFVFFMIFGGSFVCSTENNIGIDRFNKDGWYRIYNKQQGSYIDAAHASTVIYQTNFRNDHTTWRLEGLDPSSSLITEIRRSQIDKELFDTYLVEESYFQAYQMAITNEQGDLWRRQAVARAKQAIEKYTRRGLFEGDEEANLQALTIVESFAGTPVYTTLREHHDDIAGKARKRYEAFLQRPEVSMLSVSLQEEMLRQFFGDD